ncbi:MAG: D-aminoacyl-tRNA deacylase [Candidatus Methanomethylicia archaeon]
MTIIIESRVIVFASINDIAAQNIKNQLIRNHNFKMEYSSGIKVYRNKNIEALIVEIPVDSIYAEKLEDKFKAELFIFASRHSAESRIPALLSHTPGNWTEDTSLGGESRKIAIASPKALKIAVNEMEKLTRENNLSEYKVGLEVTHHGPYVENTPTIFIELGSVEENWRDERAAYIVSEAIIKVIESRFKMKCNEYKVAIGLGGPHYAPTFTRKILETEYAIGHIIPEYVYDKITERELEMAIKRNDEEVNYVLIEWKGLKRNHREMTIRYLEEKGRKWIKI